jgi:DNA polymerase-1
LFDNTHIFVGHNITAFDLLFFGTHNLPWEKADFFDTLTGECIISTTGRRDVSKSLRESVRRRLDIAINKDIEHSSWNNETLTPEQISYAVEDVTHLVDLMHTQQENAKNSGQLQALEFEMRSIKAFVRMTLNGLPLKPKVLNAWLGEQLKIRSKSEIELKRLLGDINFNSPKQKLAALAAIGVQLPNTKAETFQDISMYGSGKVKEIADLFLSYSGPAQRLKMYSKEWQQQHIINEWIHPRFWSAGTDTLRMSSSDPNIQQVPGDGRKVFGGVDGHQIVWGDYSQIEVRIAAHIAQDVVLNKLLREDDVHTAVAAQVFGVDTKQVTKEQRQASKAMTFLLLFGGGSTKLHEYMRGQGSSATEGDVNNMFNNFFTSFSGLATMRRRAYALSSSRRVVSLRLPNGAKRVLVGMKNAPTVILNTMVQGTCAIGLKRALQLCYERGLMKYIGAAVHDELVATVPNDEVVEFSAALSKAMIDGMNDITPNMLVKVEVKHADFWSK